MGWILKLVIGFFIKKAAKYGAKFNWAQAKEAWDLWLAKVLPGDMFDEEGIYILNKAVDVLSGILSSADSLMEIVKLVEAKDLKGAIMLLKQKILDVVLPGHGLTAPSSNEVVEAIKSYKKASA